MLPKVVLFTSNGCSYCEQVKQFLNENKVEYAVINISEEPKYRKLLMSKAIMQVPALLYDNKTFVTGYKPDEIKALLGI